MCASPTTREHAKSRHTRSTPWRPHTHLRVDARHCAAARSGACASWPGPHSLQQSSRCPSSVRARASPLAPAAAAASCPALLPSCTGAALVPAPLLPAAAADRCCRPPPACAALSPSTMSGGILASAAVMESGAHSQRRHISARAASAASAASALGWHCCAGPPPLPTAAARARVARSSTRSSAVTTRSSAARDPALSDCPRLLRERRSPKCARIGARCEAATRSARASNTASSVASASSLGGGCRARGTCVSGARAS